MRNADVVRGGTYRAKSGKDTVLVEVLSLRVSMDCRRTTYLCKSLPDGPPRILRAAELRPVLVKKVP